MAIGGEIIWPTVMAAACNLYINLLAVSWLKAP
jgi:hypothetical protein